MESSIGIAPEYIAVGMRNALDDLSFQWEHHVVRSGRTLGIATHAALVRIHPFVDGNDRVTRLLADLVFLAAQTGLEPLLVYDGGVGRRTYIQLLRECGRTRDPTALAEFVPVISIEEPGSG